MPSRRRLSSIAARIAVRESPPSFEPSRHRKENFRRENDLFAFGEIAQCASDDLLTRAIGIDVGRVEEIDAKFQRLLDKRPGLSLRPVTRDAFRAWERHSSCSRARCAKP